ALQSLIWRIPKGGGEARVWFGDKRLELDVGEPFFGPGGMRLMPDKQTLMFTTLVQRPEDSLNSSSGVVWTLRIQSDGRPGKPHGLGLDDRGRVIVANQSYGAQDPNHWALLSVDVGDPEVTPARPRIGGAGAEVRHERVLLGATRGMRVARRGHPFRIRVRAL